MRRLTLAAVLSLSAWGCNKIIGVEDVTLAEPKDAGTSKTSRSDEDPDDETTPPRTTRADSGAKSTGCAGAADCKRIAFVTSAAFSGDLGGTAGADAKCNAAAKTVAGLAARSFRAWLSGTGKPAGDRVARGTDTYRRTDDAIIASSYTDLVDGTLEKPISLDENGNTLGSGTLDRSVWTGTTSAGAADTFNCLDWTSADILETGTYGDSTETTAAWSESAQSSCNAQRHLYCLEE